MLEMAASAQMRSDFARLTRAAVEAGRSMTPGAAVEFLDAMSRWTGGPVRRAEWREGRMLL